MDEDGYGVTPDIPSSWVEEVDGKKVLKQVSQFTPVSSMEEEGIGGGYGESDPESHEKRDVEKVKRDILWRNSEHKADNESDGEKEGILEGVKEGGKKQASSAGATGKIGDVKSVNFFNESSIASSRRKSPFRSQSMKQRGYVAHSAIPSFSEDQPADVNATVLPPPVHPPERAELPLTYFATNATVAFVSSASSSSSSSVSSSSSSSVSSSSSSSSSVSSSSSSSSSLPFRAPTGLSIHQQNIAAHDDSYELHDPATTIPLHLIDEENRRLAEQYGKLSPPMFVERSSSDLDAIGDDLSRPKLDGKKKKIHQRILNFLSHHSLFSLSDTHPEKADSLLTRTKSMKKVASLGALSSQSSTLTHDDPSTMMGARTHTHTSIHDPLHPSTPPLLISTQPLLSSTPIGTPGLRSSRSRTSPSEKSLPAAGISSPPTVIRIGTPEMKEKAASHASSRPERKSQMSLSMSHALLSSQQSAMVQSDDGRMVHDLSRIFRHLSSIDSLGRPSISKSEGVGMSHTKRSPTTNGDTRSLTETTPILSQHSPYAFGTTPTAPSRVTSSDHPSHLESLLLSIVQTDADLLHRLHSAIQKAEENQMEEGKRREKEEGGKCGANDQSNQSLVMSSPEDRSVGSEGPLPSDGASRLKTNAEILMTSNDRHISAPNVIPINTSSLHQSPSDPSIRPALKIDSTKTSSIFPPAPSNISVTSVSHPHHQPHSQSVSFSHTSQSLIPPAPHASSQFPRSSSPGPLLSPSFSLSLSQCLCLIPLFIFQSFQLFSFFFLS
jgi:hypothetical protein